MIQSYAGLIARTLACAALTLALASQAFAGGGAGEDSTWTKEPSTWQVEIRPIQFWIPSTTTEVTLPDLPNRPNGEATSSMDGAYSGGFRLEKNKWSVDGNYMFVDFTADNPNPKVRSDMGIQLLQFMGGREILPGLSLEGGFRRMTLDLSAKLLELPEVSGKVGVWDPLVGMTYRRRLGRKWRLHLHGDGGGFGAGSDVTYSAMAALDWRFAKHFGASFGYNVLHFETSNQLTHGTLTTEPTMHGPIIAFNLFF